MDFVAFDFETAAPSRTSACALGLAVVKDNSVVDTRYYLIKPEPLVFHPFNVNIHGITEDDVANAPTFDELWSEISPLFSDVLLVAHNASFDVSVLRRCLDLFDLDYPLDDFLCTYRLAQSAFPHMGSYRLNILCRTLGIDLVHHNAQSDSIACAKLLCNILESHNINTIADIESRFNISTGYLSRYHYSPCRLNRPVCRESRSKRARDYLSINSDYVDEDFCGKFFVFTGTLTSMTRQEAFKIVASGGGIPQDNITKKTNYLVVGLQDYRVLNGSRSSKMKKADVYKANGQDIQVIVEDEFISMIDDELYVKSGMISM